MDQIRLIRKEERKESKKYILETSLFIEITLSGKQDENNGHWIEEKDDIEYMNKIEVNTHEKSLKRDFIHEVPVRNILQVCSIKNLLIQVKCFEPSFDDFQILLGIIFVIGQEYLLNFDLFIKNEHFTLTKDRKPLYKSIL